MQGDQPEATEPLALELRDLISVLSYAFDVPEQMEGALRARLKHLQRLGFPESVNTGTGKRAVYDTQAILAISMALDLVRVQLTPEQAVAIIKLNPMIVQSLTKVARSNPDYNAPELHYLGVEYPADLLSNRDPGLYRVKVSNDPRTVTSIPSPNTSLTRRGASFTCLTYLIVALNRALSARGFSVLTNSRGRSVDLPRR